MLYKLTKTGYCDGVYFKSGEIKELPDSVAKALGPKKAIPMKGVQEASAPVEGGSVSNKALSKMTKAELEAKAKEMGFSDELITSLDKNGLIATIQEELDAEAANSK